MRVKLFAVLRDVVGAGEASIELSPNATAGDAVNALCAQHPGLAAFAERVAVAVNMAYVGRDVRLTEGDEVALIPPVSGG
ncbi:MAG TPA: MoaD/ThiS family protein [Tepidisphaeraceae bacterium]